MISTCVGAECAGCVFSLAADDRFLLLLSTCCAQSALWATGAVDVPLGVTSMEYENILHHCLFNT